MNPSWLLRPAVVGNQVLGTVAEEDAVMTVIKSTEVMIGRGYSADRTIHNIL